MRRIVLLLCLLTSWLSASAQIAASEQRAARALDRAKSGPAAPLAVYAFLARMPKGADLHMHLSGAIYAETFLHDAIVDNLCVNPSTLAFAKNVGLARSLPPQPVCIEGAVPASAVLTDQHLYDALIDSFSMRSFVPSAGTSGHDHFFATFDRFSGLDKSHAGEWLDEVATRAAAQNEQYLEIMQSPSFTPAATLGNKIGWPSAVPEDTSAASPLDSTDSIRSALGHLRDQLLADPGFRDNLSQARKELTDALANRNRIERCGTAAAAGACSVQIRFLGQVLRAFPPEQVFAQTLLYFELASTDPDVVGINFVQPEDARLAMSEYTRQMLMLDFLHSVYPKIHIALHAGELAPGLVPPEGLLFHIRQAVDLGHAERIGHGVDILYEQDPNALLKELADRHIMVEINLTSNDVILGVSGPRHPLPAYRAAHVPVALATDDEGVSRIDLTTEYTRAALDFNLSYIDLKNMARTSIEHSFLPGPSLWLAPDVFTRTASPCAAQPLGADSPSRACLDFLTSSPRAAQQWELEHRFHVFESTLAHATEATPGPR